MPRRKSNFGYRTRGAEAIRRVIANQTVDVRASSNDLNRQRLSQIRASEPAERRAARLEYARERSRRSRFAASDDLRSQQNERDRLRVAATRLLATNSRNYNRLAFRYDPNQDYSSSRHVVIGTMTSVCPYCKALKFTGETKGMCCASGKIRLPLHGDPPEPLKTLLAGFTSDSINFLSNIRKFFISNFYFIFFISNFHFQI